MRIIGLSTTTPSAAAASDVPDAANATAQVKTATICFADDIADCPVT
jgi:hypothetical protein